MRLFKIFLISLIVILVVSTLFLSFKLQNVGKEPDKKVVNNSREFQTVSVKMPDGERLIADVHYGKTTEVQVKLPRGRTIAKEVLPSSNNGKMSKEEIEEIVKDLIGTLKLDQKFQAMNRIIFTGEMKNISSKESVEAANEFRKCLDNGKNPEECVIKLKRRYKWIADVNFTDLVLLYKNW